MLKVGTLDSPGSEGTTVDNLKYVQGKGTQPSKHMQNLYINTTGHTSLTSVPSSLSLFLSLSYPLTKLLVDSVTLTMKSFSIASLAPLFLGQFLVMGSRITENHNSTVEVR